MAAILSGQALTDFNALANLEKQVAFILAKLSDAEAAYNVTATTAFDNIQFAPNYDSNTLSVTVSLPMTPGGASGTPVSAVTAYLPS